jgi:hypothetical protein
MSTEERQDISEEMPLPTDGPINPVVDEGSLFDNLAKKREEIAEQTETLIPVAGYEDPQLFIQYALIPGDDIDRIGRRNQRVKDSYYRGLYNAIDVMIASCRGIYVESDNGSDPVQLTADGVPVDHFSESFAEKMRIEKRDTARNVVFGLFNYNHIAIGQHSFRLQRWMGNTSLNVDEDLLLSGM